MEILGLRKKELNNLFGAVKIKGFILIQKALSDSPLLTLMFGL